MGRIDPIIGRRALDVGLGGHHPVARDGRGRGVKARGDRGRALSGHGAEPARMEMRRPDQILGDRGAARVDAREPPRRPPTHPRRSSPAGCRSAPNTSSPRPAPRHRCARRSCPRSRARAGHKARRTRRASLGGPRSLGLGAAGVARGLIDDLEASDRTLHRRAAGQDRRRLRPAVERPVADRPFERGVDLLRRSAAPSGSTDSGTKPAAAAALMHRSWCGRRRPISSKELALNGGRGAFICGSVSRRRAAKRSGASSMPTGQVCGSPCRR